VSSLKTAVRASAYLSQISLWNFFSTALLPPSTLLQVIPHLSAHTDPPILHRTLQGGLSVLHTPRYSRVAFAARLSSELALSGPRTTADVAREESISLGLADALVCAAEEDGDVIRDQEPGAGGMRVWWWANVFKDYVWDGQVY
jgi:ESCRT-II complex subunit VPS36